MTKLDGYPSQNTTRLEIEITRMAGHKILLVLSATVFFKVFLATPSLVLLDGFKTFSWFTSFGRESAEGGNA